MKKMKKEKNIKNSENKFNKKDITQYKKLINNYSIYRYINILLYSFYIIFFHSYLIKIIFLLFIFLLIYTTSFEIINQIL